MKPSRKLMHLNNISAAYGDQIVLEDIDFSINEFDFIGVIGPNGGGKTTLLKVILGLVPLLKGHISFEPLMKESGKSIGYLPQQTQNDLQFPITVEEVVLSGLASQKKLFGRHTPEDYLKARVVMQQMGVIHLKERPVGELSGGQRQRALIARAIIASPRLLLLDEPNTFVDQKLEMELFHILRDLNSEMAIMVVSHDVGMISPFIKSIACINRTLHYHPSNEINNEVLLSYNCPIDLITHGQVPHRVLRNH